MKNSQLSMLEPFDKSVFSENRCFLCGIQLTVENNTGEHVFPQWLLHKYSLWDRTITLLNQTSIPYRNLKIPCCFPCNSGRLSELENEIKTAVENGPKSVAQLDKLRLYQWMGKIFFGLLFRELSLFIDRSKPEFGSITTPELLQEYLSLHDFIQSIVKPIEFKEFFPGSIFIFEVEEFPGFDKFDFSDNIFGMALCIRLGNIGIVACLKDDEQLSDFFAETYQAVKDVRLHPIQYDEFCALVFYRSCSMVRDGKYVSVTSPENGTTIVKLPGFSLAPVFSDWNYEIFARFLEKFWVKWGISIDEIFIPPNSIRTYLGDYI